MNELDRLRRQMREKDLSEMISKLTHLKFHAKTSEEILQIFEDIRQNLEYLQCEVIINNSLEKRQKILLNF